MENGGSRAAPGCAAKNTHLVATERRRRSRRVKLSASLEATVKECVLSVSDVDPRLAVEADRDLLSSAVGNLLQNAFKFTRPKSEVTLTVYAVADRIFIEVQDHCGGLAAGDAEKMFLPFTQSGEDRTGLGLGTPAWRHATPAMNEDGNQSFLSKSSSSLALNTATI